MTIKEYYNVTILTKDNISVRINRKFTSRNSIREFIQELQKHLKRRSFIYDIEYINLK